MPRSAVSLVSFVGPSSWSESVPSCRGSVSWSPHQTKVCGSFWCVLSDVGAFGLSIAAALDEVHGLPGLSLLTFLSWLVSCVDHIGPRSAVFLDLSFLVGLGLLAFGLGLLRPRPVVLVGALSDVGTFGLSMTSALFLSVVFVVGLGHV